MKFLIDARNPAEGIDRYFSLTKHEIHISGTGDAQVLDLALKVDDEELQDQEPVIARGKCVTARIRVRLNEQHSVAHLLLYIHDQAMGALVCMPVLDPEFSLLELEPGESDFPMYRGLPSAQAGGLPVASEAAARVICLPIYPDLDDANLTGSLIV